MYYKENDICNDANYQFYDAQELSSSFMDNYAVSYRSDVNQYENYNDNYRSNHYYYQVNNTSCQSYHLYNQSYYMTP